MRPGTGPIRSSSSLGAGRREPNSPNPRDGGSLKIRRTSVTVRVMALPALMKNGTPDQRQLSMPSRRAANVSVVEAGSTPGDCR